MKKKDSLPLKILDVGGRPLIWEREGFCEGENIFKYQIHIVNLEPIISQSTNIQIYRCDALNMSCFQDNEFDIAFSNSVIEHVGNYTQQEQFVQEIKRVAKSYFVQTPNYYFPIEPHFLFPFYQFLPLWLQIFLLTRAC